MDTTVKESPLVQKTLDLCRAVAEQPDFQSLKDKLDAFMRDELVKFQYQQLNELGNLLQLKQQGGVPLKDEEVAQFEALRESLLQSPVAQGFIEAQQELQKLHESIGRFVNKTFELGRSPEYEDIFDGSCSDCGCH